MSKNQDALAKDLHLFINLADERKLDHIAGFLKKNFTDIVDIAESIQTEEDGNINKFVYPIS